MVQLAIIDRDGVIADVTRRLRIAQKLASYDASANTSIDHSSHLSQEVIDAVPIDWDTFFLARLIALDTVIEHAPRLLADLYRQGYLIRYLTSTPDRLRDCTHAWMLDHGIPLFPRYGLPVPFLHKPASAQYLKTAIWKVLVVAGTQVAPILNLTEREEKLVRELERQQALTKRGLLDPALYDGEEVERLMIIDDEPRNQKLFELLDRLELAEPGQPPRRAVHQLKTYASLEEALAELQREE